MNEKSGVEVFVNGESVGIILVGMLFECDLGNFKVCV